MVIGAIPMDVVFAENNMEKNEKQDQQIEALFEHARIANEEMGIIRNDVGWIKEKMECFEKRFDKLDNRIWWILSTVVVGFLANLYFK